MFDFGRANEVQKQAITTTEGPVLIIAGPGTGKTFTLVKRAVYLIAEKHVAPEDIMIATFTEKAAKELLTRLSNELLALNISVNINDLYIGTIHSICLRLIKEHLEYTTLHKDYRLVDDFEQKYLVYQNHKRFRSIVNSDLVLGEAHSSWALAEDVCYYANAIAEELVDEEKLAKSNQIELRAVSEIVSLYRSILSDENALDFSSIQCVAYRMLVDHPEICEQLQEQIKYIMIDEYQDTNYVQEQLVMLLGAKRNNICVVGDDDQGLYRFRGATIRNILEFPEKFDSCQKFFLSENYRSEKDIIGFYNQWMRTTSGSNFEFDWAQYRYPKSITAAKSEFIEGQPTVIKVSGNEDADTWMENVVDFIKKLKASGKLTDYNQLAFLFKSVKHANVIALGNYLEQNGIPVYSPRSDLFFEREEIRLIIGALMFMFPNYVKKLTEGKAYIRPELEKYYTDCLRGFSDFVKRTRSDELMKWCKFRAVDHLRIQKNLDYAFSGLMYQMFQFEPFKSILDTDITTGINDTRPVRNIAKFIELVTKYEFMHRVNIFTVKNIDFAVERFFSIYLRFLIDGGISEYEDDSEYAPSGCVSFMTIHQSKGLEFPIVVVGSLYGVPRNNNDEIIEMLEHDFYHRKPFEPADKIKLFDFWRLYYTAFSRAQNLLVLTAKEVTGRGADPSKYFEQIYGELPYYWDPDIDYSKYKFETVKDVNIKNSYAFTSSISVYETCAVQYKFFKELGFVAVRSGQTMFGTLVHQTIEDIHKAALRNESHTITTENVTKWFNINYEAISRKEHSFLDERVRAAALKHILNYVEQNDSRWGRIRAAEVEVSHVEPEFILTGKVDLISGDGDTVEIVDFKSEKKPDMVTDSDRIERYRKQLEIYAYIIEHQYGLKFSKMHLYYTGTEHSSPIITFEHRKSEVDQAIRSFTDIVRKIERKEFSCQAKNHITCRECDFRYFCGKV